MQTAPRKNVFIWRMKMISKKEIVALDEAQADQVKDADKHGAKLLGHERDPPRPTNYGSFNNYRR